MYRQLYPLPTIFCYSSAINSKMPPKKSKVGKPKATSPASPTRTAVKAALAKRKTSPKGGKSSPPKKLKQAPVPWVQATPKTPSPDRKKKAQGGQAHTVTSVDIRTAESPDDQEDLTATMEGGGGGSQRIDRPLLPTHIWKKQLTTILLC
jgi:hypothetical protein